MSYKKRRLFFDEKKAGYVFGGMISLCFTQLILDG
jgi:hypothetical protein